MGVLVLQRVVVHPRFIDDNTLLLEFHKWRKRRDLPNPQYLDAGTVGRLHGMTVHFQGVRASR